MNDNLKERVQLLGFLAFAYVLPASMLAYTISFDAAVEFAVLTAPAAIIALFLALSAIRRSPKA